MPATSKLILPGDVDHLQAKQRFDSVEICSL